MADLKAAQNEPEHQLFEEIDGVHAGMLGIEGSGRLQPMAPQLDRASRTIWFFARTGSDIAAAAARPGARGVFVLVGRHHDYHATLTGTLTERLDTAVRDRFWSSVIEAWYRQGKDDPELTMLEFRPDHADMWVSTDSTLKFGWEIAKAQVSDSEPDVGTKIELTF